MWPGEEALESSRGLWHLVTKGQVRVRLQEKPHRRVPSVAAGAMQSGVPKIILPTPKDRHTRHLVRGKPPKRKLT